MATGAKRPCAYPNCPELTTSQYCPTHSKQVAARYDKARGTAAQRGYDATWRKVRAHKLALYPLCQLCETQGRLKPAVLVHHIDRDPRNNAPGNLQSLCVQCHEEEHKSERFGR